MGHGLASSISGMQPAGDLVARMQGSLGMRIKEDKDYVAAIMGISVKG